MHCDFQQSHEKGSSQITELKKIMPRANSIALYIHRWAKLNVNFLSYGNAHTVWLLGLSVRESIGSAATAVCTVLEALVNLTIHRYRLGGGFTRYVWLCTSKIKVFPDFVNRKNVD